MSELDKNNPFKTPEGYFESFESGLLEKLSDKKLNLSKDEGFTVPENYFDDLHKNIVRKLDVKETKVVQLNAYHKYYIAITAAAAMLLLFIGLNWHSTENLTFDELADSDIETYFDSYEYGLSSYEIAEILSIEGLEINDVLEGQLNEEIVIDYLNENIDDFEELNTEYYE